MDDYAKALIDRVAEALPGWVELSVATRARSAGRDPVELAEAAGRAGREAVGEAVPALRRLLVADIDEQSGTPLEVIRRTGRFPTAVLRDAGVPAPARDRFTEERFPDDIYDLGPAALADLSPEAAEAGLHWGAAKALAHRRRHQLRPPAGDHGEPG